mgnify:CR=1 FL=1
MASAPLLSRRGLLAAFVLAGSTLALRPVRAAETPEAFLKAIYAAYLGDGSGIDLNDKRALDRYFTPDLATMIADDRAHAEAAEDVPMLDGDPFIDAQDWEIENLAITVEHGAEGKATGHVRLVNAGTPVAIDVRLVETPAGWRIRDIHWPNGSLRGLYTH